MFRKLFNKKKKELREADENYVFDKAKYHFDSNSARVMAVGISWALNLLRKNNNIR